MSKSCKSRVRELQRWCGDSRGKSTIIISSKKPAIAESKQAHNFKGRCNMWSELIRLTWVITSQLQLLQSCSCCWHHSHYHRPRGLGKRQVVALPQLLHEAVRAPASMRIWDPIVAPGKALASRSLEEHHHQILRSIRIETLWEEGKQKEVEIAAVRWCCLEQSVCHNFAYSTLSVKPTWIQAALKVSSMRWPKRCGKPIGFPVFGY